MIWRRIRISHEFLSSILQHLYFVKFLINDRIMTNIFIEKCAQYIGRVWKHFLFFFFSLFLFLSSSCMTFPKIQNRRETERERGRERGRKREREKKKEKKTRISHFRPYFFFPSLCLSVPFFHSRTDVKYPFFSALLLIVIITIAIYFFVLLHGGNQERNKNEMEKNRYDRIKKNIHD